MPGKDNPENKKLKDMTLGELFESEDFIKEIFKLIKIYNIRSQYLDWRMLLEEEGLNKYINILDDFLFGG